MQSFFFTRAIFFALFSPHPFVYSPPPPLNTAAVAPLMLLRTASGYYTHTHTHKHTHTRKHTHASTHTRTLAHTHKNTCKHTHTCTYLGGYVCACSHIHHTHTHTHTHTHRHEEQTWSMERTESMNSDCQSGALSSSVGTSKCSSPACMARRGAPHWGCGQLARPAAGMTYGDSYDSLRDSPHSDR